MKKKQLVSFAAPWLAICFSAAGESGPSEIVELSPFVINASADKGYEGTHTLSGSGTSKPIVERYIVGPGRNYAFQSTFAF